MTQELDKPGIILWAVDPFREPPAESEELNRSAAWALHALTRRMKVEVQPLYVLDASAISNEVLNELRKEGQEILDGIFARIKISGLQPLDILREAGHRPVDQLLRYAHHQGAELIVTSTHGRHGLQRWMKGSFTEDLILQSDIPLFVVSPKWQRVPNFERILFPTDFSEASRTALDEVIELAISLDSQIVLFHKINFEPAPSVEVAFGSYPTYRESYSALVGDSQEQLQRWVESLQRRGLRATSILDTSLVGSAESSILEESEKSPGLIAMAAQSGGIAATLLGSLTRKIVRSARTPVWIVHPHLQSRRRRNSEFKSAA